jgi:hypothetical protein
LASRPVGWRYHAVSWAGGGQLGRSIQRREPVTNTRTPERGVLSVSATSTQCITHPDAGVEAAAVTPRPDQQADSAARCPERCVVGEHPAEEKVVPAALQYTTGGIRATFARWSVACQYGSSGP